LLDINTMISP